MSFLPDYGTLDSLLLFCLLSVIRKEWLDQRRPINAYGWIPDRFYVISMKFLLLSRSCSQARRLFKMFFCHCITHGRQRM